MINMMIVDDEPLVRLAMHRLIDWDAFGIRIVCEAADGSEALAQLRQRSDIDLLLADIQMPRLSGIELLKALGEPDVPRRPVTIMLSAYSDYSYVREAFLLGALDYIVKADMEEAHIVPVIEKAVQEVARLHEGTASAQEGSQAASARAPWEKEAFLQELLAFDPQGEAPAIDRTRLAETALVHEKNQVVIVIQPAGSLDLAKTQGFVQQTMQTVLHELSILHEIVRLEDGGYALLCVFPHDRSESAIRAKVSSALSLMQTRLLQFVNAAVSAGVSDLGSGCARWSRLVRQAAQLAAMSYYEGTGKLMFPELALAPAAGGKAQLWEELKAIRLSLPQALKQPDEGEWLRVFGQLEKRLPGARPEPPSALRAFFGDVVWDIGAVLYAKGIRIEDVQPSALSPLQAVKQLDTCADTLNYLRSLLQRVHTHLHDGKGNALRFSPPVAAAKKFLDLHFREEVNQTLISDMVGVSESYLSKQFVKEVGSNFIHYLTNLRIEEAKRLLAHGHRIADVSEEIGYFNPEHFSRIFKKVTGFSPKVYRDQTRS
ncbi:response regulator transcription factor [Paenibacillus whitsoniae]|uniref:Response regulator n=1 Tax=Paenibacillus whitsoniae TaxID=2496558 RepID=A0A430JD41_9BACL|nr:helix-turn-helix domain-containing protein [Paenibacillus whitsoniae]RTE08931.1 response regulator [Paenibacillus whitsoniae]